MVSQLLVASGVAATCGLLGVNEWLRGRAWRTRLTHNRSAPTSTDGGDRR